MLLKDFLGGGGGGGELLLGGGAPPLYETLHCEASLIACMSRLRGFPLRTGHATLQAEPLEIDYKTVIISNRGLERVGSWVPGGSVGRDQLAMAAKVRRHWFNPCRLGSRGHLGAGFLYSSILTSLRKENHLDILQMREN